MKFREVKRHLLAEYPGAHIVVTTRRGRKITEVVAERGKSPNSPYQNELGPSLATAVIDENRRHYHRRTTEIYTILKGVLDMEVDGIPCKLAKGESITITPGQRHYAKGNATWVAVESFPFWTPDDYFED